MVDSVVVLDPAWQAPVNPATQLPYPDVLIAFFDSGTTNAKTVYADADLSDSLGTVVSCNSLGFPVTSGNAKTLIYVSAAPYKIRFTSVTFGGTIAEFDEVRGALDTSGFLTSAAAYDESVVTTSSNRAVGASDHGKLIDFNCTAGTLTATVDDANTLGDGWFTFLRHAGTANQVKIIGDGTDIFALPGASPVAFSLVGLGQCVKITCNGSNFKVTEMAPPFIGGSSPVLVVADQTSTPPGSPTAGSRYIVGASPTGAWSGFAENDIAEATGQGTWFKRTPAADSGILAFIQSMDVFKGFIGSAWRGAAKVNMQAFTSSGTYTPMAGMSWCIVVSTGGGGGGGGADTNGSGIGGASGGTAGATAIELFTAAQIGASQTVTIGAAGASGSGQGGNGGDGGDTTFGALHTAGGGPGGTGTGINSTSTNNSISHPGASSATGGLINIPGGLAGDGFGHGGTGSIMAIGGHGGNSFWGGGGGQTAAASGAVTPGMAAMAPGSGGAGAANSQQTTEAGIGGIGRAGMCVVIEFG